MGGIILNFAGERIVRRGGDKSLDKVDPQEADDAMLSMEIMARAPNMLPEDYQDAFIALRMEYGKDALDAIRKGYVKFEKQSTRDMPDIGPFPPTEGEA